MSQIYTKKMIDKMYNKQDIRTLILVRGYSTNTTKTGAPYISGNMESLGTVGFKVWQNSVAFQKFQDNDFTNTICMIEGSINEYGGVKSIVVENIRVADEDDLNGVSANDFYASKYDSEALWKSIHSFLNSKLDASTMEVFNIIFSDSIVESFKNEFAAEHHHDNVRSGLIAHTFKTLNLLKAITMYENIVNHCSLDLLFLGVVVHDIGKIVEYDSGVVSETGKLVSHNTLGVEILVSHRREIVELKGEEFYYRLLAIVEQHHGEYADRPRTVEAFVINQFDTLDSLLTSLNQTIESAGENASKMNVFDYKLS